MSDYGNGNRPPPRVKNALDNKKLNLYAKCPTAPDKTASLTWGLDKNNPRIIVWTNDPTETTQDKGYGKIMAAMDGPVFFAFLAVLQEVVDAPGEIKRAIKNKQYIFPNRVRSEKPVETSRLHIVKEADGVIFLSVTAKDRPVIKFVLSLSDFHEFIGDDGQPMSAAASSKLAAKAYINMLTPFMAVMMATNYVEPPPPPQRNGGNGGGGGGNNSYGNRGGGNGGGGGGAAPDTSGDIPW